MSFRDSMNALPRIIPVSEVQVGDIITVKPPRGNRITFKVVIASDLALTGVGRNAKTLAPTNQHRMVSRSWAELSEITLVAR